MTKLLSLRAYQILDSRGNPTVAVEGRTERYKAVSKVPSGASTGTHEALEMRDNDSTTYGGKGVLKACNMVNTVIYDTIKDIDINDQRAVDMAMIAIDNTSNKAYLGANSMLAVSMVVSKLAALENNRELYKHIQILSNSDTIALPYPMFNVLNGGVHSDAGLAIQEFMIIPQHKKYTERLQAATEIYHTLKKLLKKKGYTVSVGDEGGFAPHLKTSKEALSILMESIIDSGYNSDTVKLAMDSAASEFYNEELYNIDSMRLSSSLLTDYYETLCKEYPIISIEDSHSEDDIDGFKSITERLGDSVQIVGDDLFCTNTVRLKAGIDGHYANAILIKPNQIGTITETLEAIHMAKKNGYKTIISHRSGETEDTYIADLAVGTGAMQIKTGAPCRSERVCKYNRLLEIAMDIE